MGFWRNLDRSIDQFFEFRPAAYKAQIAGLSQPELKRLHKITQQKIVGAGTQTGLGIAGAAATGGLSLVVSGIGARRIDVNQQRCEVIEQLLEERGWAGHDFRKRDFLVGILPGATAAAFAPGADHVADQLVNHAIHSGAQVATDQVHQNAATALGMTAVHQTTHAAIKQGTNYVLTSSSRPGQSKPAQSKSVMLIPKKVQVDVLPSRPTVHPTKRTPRTHALNADEAAHVLFISTVVLDAIRHYSSRFCQLERFPFLFQLLIFSCVGFAIIISAVWSLSTV
ncbi:hypothetical protein OQA88_836 [Cercophora sp. LCS_1]